MTNPALNTAGLPESLSHVLISLMKGVVYQEESLGLWQALLNLQGRVRDHVSVLGLQLVLDETEGYAYLRQRPTAEGEPALPRLVPRRQLSYGVSLLLALLRKKLVDLDAAGGSSRLVLRREDIHDLVRLFLPDATDEVRRVDRLDVDIAKVVDLGFLRKLRESEDTFEVRRILKAFVDAQWLDAFEQRLAGYRAHLAEEGGGSE
jgi:hypothetical protein